MSLRFACALATLAGFALSQGTNAQEPIRLYAAGSLAAALTGVAQAVTREYGVPVQTTFGASGLLRERIEKGEPVDVFASANMEHPLLLTKDGRGGPTVLFARNALCGL